MSATPVHHHHVDMTPDTYNAASDGPSQLITGPGAAVTVSQDGSKSSSSSSTLSQRKVPPPEKPSDIRRRTLVILSFWLIVLCLGLPIWWKTTAIPRADLPLHEMMDWADGKVCFVLTRVSLALSLPFSVYNLNSHLPAILADS